MSKRDMVDQPNYRHATCVLTGCSRWTGHDGPCTPDRCRRRRGQPWPLHATPWKTTR